jgi:DNA-binding NtrC family response regulator
VVAGNVRELENIIDRAAVLSEGSVISRTAIMLPRPATDAEGTFREAKAKLIGQFETSYIRGQLAANNGNVSRAARAAGKNRRAFFELIRKHNINVESIKLSS